MDEEPIERNAMNVSSGGEESFQTLAIVLFKSILYVLLHLINNAEENETKFINRSTINAMHNNLERFVPREYWTSFIDSNDCAYRSTRVKSKVRFVVMPLHSFGCRSTSTYSWVCYEYSRSLQQGHRDQNYRNIYYNYFITTERSSFIRPRYQTYQTYIYEGRSLTCPFDEFILSEDHSSMITVGIDYCFPGRTRKNSESSLIVTDRIWDLIFNLKEKEILTEDYELEFPYICKDSYLVERVNRLSDATGRISFYEHNIYKDLNLSTAVDPTIVSSMLFLSKDTEQTETTAQMLLPKSTSTSDTNSSSTSELQKQSPSNILVDNYNLSSTIIVDNITIRFPVISEFENSTNLNSKYCGSGENFKRECLPEITDRLKGRISGVDKSIGNYFTFPYVSDGQIPINNSGNISDSDSVVNIFLIYDVAADWSEPNENAFVWIGQAFASIRKDLLKRFKFSRLDFQFVYEEGVPWQYNYLQWMYDIVVDSPIEVLSYRPTNYEFIFLPSGAGD